MADELNQLNLNEGLRIDLNLPGLDNSQETDALQTLGGALIQQQTVENPTEQKAAQEIPEIETIQTEEEKPVEWGSKEWLDVAASPFRGVLAAGQSVIELMDTVTGDIIPDIDIRFLGKSETQAGKIIEGISQFATGFLVSGGVVGAAAKAVGAASFLAKAPIVSGLIKGSVTDFSFMDANQERLSNLIQDIPALQNPISAYLASDKDEGELEGRLKNALEGAGIGAAIDTMVHYVGAGVRAMKKASKLRAEGVEPEKVAEIVSKDMEAATKSEPIAIKEETAAKEQVAVTKIVEQDGAIKIEKKEGDITEVIDIATKEDVDRVVVDILDEVGGRGEHSNGISTITSKLLQTAKNDEELASYSKAVFEAIDKRLSDINPKSASEAAALVRRQQKKVLSSGGGQRITEEEARKATILGDKTIPARVRSQAEGYGYMVQNMAKDLDKKIASGIGLTAQEEKDFADLLYLSYKWSGINKEFGSSFGRGLQTQRNIKQFKEAGESLVEAGLPQQTEVAKQQALFLNNFENIVKNEPEKMKELVQKHVNLLANADNVNDILENATKTISTNGRIMDAGVEYFINSLLSPKSCIVNTLSSAMQIMIRPLEFALGSGLRGGEVQYAKQAFGQMFADMGQAFEHFKKSFIAGRGTFGATQVELDGNIKAISAQAFDINSKTNPIHAMIIDGLGRAVRFSGDIMQATDSAFKFLGMRSAAAGRFSYEAYEKGLRGDSLNQYVAERLSQYFNERGLINSQSASYLSAAKEAKLKGLKGMDAVNYIDNRAQALFDKNRDSVGRFVRNEAGEVTNTRTFGEDPGIFGQAANAVSAAAKRYPLLKLFVPFVNTPAQLLRYVSEHTPLTGQIAALNKSAVAEMASKDPLIRSAAYGRLYTGTVMWGVGASLALSGRITGYGPQDPRERKALMATGWKPYSIRVGDTYYQFARLDPISSFLGIAADVVEQARTGVEQDDAFHSIAFQSAWLPLQKNFTNKTFMRGFADMIDLLSASDEDALQRVMLGKVGALIPSTISNLAAGLGNDFSIGGSSQPGDYLLRRIPGLTGLVDRNRNILGEPIDVTPEPGRNILDPINPFVMGVNRGDKILNEVARLKHPFSPPKKKLGGVVDLTKYTNKNGQTAYDRYAELVGQVSLGGDTIRKQLGKLISSSRYKNMSDIYLEGYTSPKVEAINKVVSKYRAKALQQLLKEFPDVANAWGVRNETRASLKQNRYQGLING